MAASAQAASVGQLKFEPCAACITVQRRSKFACIVHSSARSVPREILRPSSCRHTTGDVLKRLLRPAACPCGGAHTRRQRLCVSPDSGRDQGTLSPWLRGWPHGQLRQADHILVARHTVAPDTIAYSSATRPTTLGETLTRVTADATRNQESGKSPVRGGIAPLQSR